MARPDRRPVLVLLTLLVLAASGCTGEPAAPGPTTVTIGLLAGTTGLGAGTGADAIRGAQLAIDLVNRDLPDVALPLAPGAGLAGLGGATLALATGDTGGDPGTVSDAATTLITRRHADVLVVADVAAVAEAAGSEAQRLSVPVIDALSSADYLTELGLDWYFRVGPTDQTLAEAALAVVHGQLNRPARVAVLNSGAMHGTGIADAAAAKLVTELATRAGDTVAVDAAEQRPEAVDANHCDVIVALASSPSEAADATEIAAGLAVPVPMIGIGPGFHEIETSTSERTAREAATESGLLRAVPWSAESARRSPVGRAVTDLYQHKFDAPMTVAAAGAFTATLVAALAVDAAGTDHPADARGALRRLSLPATKLIMPWDGLRFDADGQNELAAGLVEASVGDGFRVVYPRELAAGPMIWPTTGSTS